ncbi:hypothetical protein [Paenibacillus periandrae]|uniref:hypothetical protein n=1 Tax=Paenibacillus periandrae TaxID=1761741 RepID=UPI001F08BD4B|nr:hypothetical protein [Paenibacillus periandrae]
MFNFLKKKKESATKTVSNSNHFQEDKEFLVLDHSHEEKSLSANRFSKSEFENKVVYLKGPDRIVTEFPKKYGNIYFEKDKYFKIMQKIYDSSNIGEHINRIEIVGYLDNAGECSTNIVNGQLKITIRIAAPKLGLIESGYIHEYTEKSGTTLNNIFAHEFVHAEDIVNIVKRYGIEEFNSIRTNKISSLAWSSLTEYSACRKTAELHNEYDSVEQIESSLIYNLLDSFKKGGATWLNPYNCIVNLNYAIATKCAFADESGDESYHLEISKSIKHHDKVSDYVHQVRRLLIENYSVQPLDKNGFALLGNKFLSEFLTIFFNAKEEQIHKIINEHFIK